MHLSTFTRYTFKKDWCFVSFPMLLKNKKHSTFFVFNFSVLYCIHPMLKSSNLVCGLVHLFYFYDLSFIWVWWFWQEGNKVTWIVLRKKLMHIMGQMSKVLFEQCCISAYLGCRAGHRRSTISIRMLRWAVKIKRIWRLNKSHGS